MEEPKSSATKTLAIRAVSAIVAVILLIFPYFYFGNIGFQIVAAIVSLLALREVDRLLMQPQDGLGSRAILFLGCILIWFFAFRDPQRVFAIFILIEIFAYILLQWIHRRSLQPGEMRSLEMRVVMGLFYMGALPAFAQMILNLPLGDHWFYTTLAMVFAGDTFAYLVGVTFGKHKMIPAISPKKSYEGSLGGIFGTVLAAFILKSHLPAINDVLWFSFAFSLALMAQFGDFFESLLKRAVDAKDSGTLLPGHGGVLDRIDGVLFALPAVYLLASYVSN